MPDYLLDTMMLRFWYDATCGENAKVLARVQTVRQPEPETGYIARLYISVVTLGEIEYGHRFAALPNPDEQARYLKFVNEQCLEPLDLVKETAKYYGELKAWVMNKSSPWAMRGKAKRLKELTDPTPAKVIGVDENDLWVAAQAMTLNLVLVTHDSRGGFGEIQRQFASVLHVDDWAR